jgi:hypothetical protein
VALAVAVVAVSLVAAIGNPFAVNQPPRSDPRIAAVLTAPDAITLTTTVTGGGSSTIVMSSHQGRLVFAASGLAPLPKSKCYMLWLIRPSGDIPASRLPPPDHGMTGPVVATGVADHNRLGLTIEPIRAPEHPTTAMLINIAL